MVLKEGNIVEISYTAKVVGGEVFDTTVEKKAVDAGIFNERASYKPVPVVLGEKELFPALEGEIKRMDLGQQKKVELQAKDAFGERKAELVTVVPLREFQKENMRPFPGLVVEINNRQGKVQSVSGGRVRIDFNHPLAGKEVEYEVKVEKELKQPKEQVEALFEKYFGVLPKEKRSLKVLKEAVEIEIASEFERAIAPLKEFFSDLITKNVKGIKEVKFVAKFGKKEEAAEEKAKEGEGKEEKEKKEEVEGKSEGTAEGEGKEEKGKDAEGKAEEEDLKKKARK